MKSLRMDKLTIIKIGGNVIDDEQKLASFLADFSSLPNHKILVHGGGKLATRLAEQLNIPQQMIDGRRITDAETLRIVTMVYAGYINKNIVALLQSLGCNALGLSGADGNVVLAHKRNRPGTDFGFAGDIDNINHGLLERLILQGFVPVIAPITHDGKGQLLNTNADTMTSEIARSLTAVFDVDIIYCFEKEGVLVDVEKEDSIITDLDAAYYNDLKNKGAIFAGMIPKLDNAFASIESGVKKVMIGKAEQLHQVSKGEKGTSISHG